MFLRLLFLTLFFFNFANSLILTNEKNTHNFKDFKLYIDKTNTKNLDFFIKNKELFKDTNKTNIGIQKNHVWTYGTITNKTKQIKQVVLSNPRAGIDFINVYVFQNGKLIKENILGDMNKQEKREVLYRKSSFKLTLKENESFEIITKYKSFGAIDINYIVQDENTFIKTVSLESTYFGFIAGIVTLILISLVFINIAYSSKVYMIYFIILLGTISIQFSVAGIFYQLGLNSYFNTIISWSLGNISAALIGLFPIYYFNLKKYMPKTSIMLYILSFSIIFLSILFLFYPLKNDLLYLAPYANLIFLVMSLLLVFVSIVTAFEKRKGYKIYLVGNTLFLISVVYFVFGLLGIVSTNELFYLSLAIGSFLNVSCLGLLIILNILKANKDKENAMTLLNEYSKLSSVGQSMINLSHQWKEPLNHIYYAINNITAAKEFNDPNLPNIIDKSLKQIQDTTTHMTNTGKNFLSVYEDKNFSEKINLQDCIRSVLTLFEKSINENNIKITLNIENEIIVDINKYLLANIFVSIIENMIKVFKNRHIKNPQIKIDISKKDASINIVIEDNAGGIKEKPINSIFEKDLSNSKSTGLGLFIVKSIVSLKLNGEIQAINTEKGASFKIKLNNYL